MIKIAKLICKSAYIKSLDHVFNTLEYAGNKIQRQEVIFKDGTIVKQDGCIKLKLSLEQEPTLKSVRLYYKDGGSKEIDWLTYSKLVSNKEEKITVSKLETVEDEIPGEFELECAQIESKEYHNLKDLDVDKYLGYIANRDGAVKEDGHGLFGIKGNISMEDAKVMAEEHQDSIIWTHIISIRGDDGDKTGFNNRNAWRNLVIAKAPDLAKIYNISLENLVVNAAYHKNTDNDHVHVIMYSKDKREGFVKGGKDGMKRATEKMKSLFLNDIFKNDVAPLKELITQQRKDIKDELKNHLVNISKSEITDKRLVNEFLSLSQDLNNHKGKCDYGYLKPEIKTKVNDFLKYTLDSNENLSALFTELMGSKRAYIELYNQDESKIENLAEESREKIFHPEKGQATLQNIIVHAIADYNKEKATPIPRNTGATKGKNSVHEDSLDTSDSIFFDVPPPPKQKLEHLPSMDEFRNLGNLQESESLEPLPPGTKAPADWYDLSEIRKKISNTLAKNQVTETAAKLSDEELELEDELIVLNYDDNTPILYDEELQWSEDKENYISVEVPQEEWDYVDNPKEDIKIFASELEYTEKMTMEEVSHEATKEKKLESTKQKDKPVSPYYELSKMIYKDISKSAYKTCSTLFNPKIQNTALQTELLAQLQEMYNLSADEKKKSKEYKDCAVKAFQIMMTDTDFYNSFNSSVDNNTPEFLLKHNFSAESKKAVTEYQKSIRNGNKLNSAHWYSQFFADNIYDHQYLQLMKAYEEFNKPLRKEMRRNIIEHLNEVTPTLKEIKELKQSIPNYLKDKDINEYIRNKISEIWGTVADTPEYQVFVDKNLEVFEEYMEPDVVDEYKKRFKTTLDEVGQLMRPHFYVITQAEHLDELQLSETFKNKELFAPVKTSIKKCLDKSIIDDSTSSQFLKQELLKDTDNTKEILRCLYAQSDIKPIIDKWAENIIKASGVEDVTKYYESFQSYLRDEPCEYKNLFNYNKLSNYIRYYKESYIEQAYTQIKKAMQPKIPKKHVFKLLSKSVTQFSEEWKELHNICEQIKISETEEEATALRQEQKKLISSIGSKSIYKDETFSQYIDSVNQAFQKHSGDNNIALTLENRFFYDMYSGDLWTAPNGYISFFAQFVPDNLVKEQFNDKELFSPVKSIVKQCLDNSITNYSFSSQFLKQELLKDTDNTKKILRCLYAQQEIKPVIDKWAENVIKASGVKDVTKYYDSFQSFLYEEPCEYENLFNYSKLTNYIRYYQSSYVEQAYTQIKKAMQPKIPNKHVFKLLSESVTQFSEEWKELHNICEQIKISETEEEVTALRQEQKKLISSIGSKSIYEDETFSQYIDSVNQAFQKHSGDNNIALTLENRFFYDMYSGDLWTAPNGYISFFAQFVPDNLVKEKLNDKELFSPVKSIVKQCLDNSITNYSFSSQFLKQELLKDTDNTKKILRCLYAQPDIKPIIDKWAENVIKASRVEDVTKYYEQFQLFLHDEPCEYENLFNYSKLTNYIRYYQSSYVEQAYTQIKKLVNTDKLKSHVTDTFQEGLPKHPEQWIALYQHIKNRPTEEDENAIKEYEDNSKKLVSKIFKKVLHKDEKVDGYISAVNKEFYRHSGDNNIALTLENRFLSDMYSGDLWTTPNMQISFFAERIPNEFLKNILHTDQSKALLKPIYKSIKKAIYTQLLSPEDNEIKDSLLQLEELSKELESCDYSDRPPLVAEIQNTICKVIEKIETPELTEHFEKLKDYLKSQVEETVPKEVQEDVTKLIENMRNGGLYMPYNYTIFAMGAETKATYGKAVAWGMKDNIKNLNHQVYQNFYEVLAHNKTKREASPIYQLVKQLINAPTPNTPKENLEQKQLHTKILAEFRQNSDFDKAYHQLENTFYQNLHDCCKIDNVSNLFETSVVDGDFGSINSTIEFMASNSESVIKRINRQKAIRCVKLVCGAIAYSLYNEANHQIQRNLSQKNTLSRGLNRFITKQANKKINQFLSY